MCQGCQKLTEGWKTMYNAKMKKNRNGHLVQFRYRDGAQYGEILQEKKDELSKIIADTAEQVSTSNNYKINKISSGIDRKSKKMLAIISDILSEKLSKFLVDEIIDEIVEALNRK